MTDREPSGGNVMDFSINPNFYAYGNFAALLYILEDTLGKGCSTRE